MNDKQKVYLELRNSHIFTGDYITTRFKFLQREGIFNFYVSRLEATPSFKNNIAEGSYLGEILIVKLMRMLYILLLEHLNIEMLHGPDFPNRCSHLYLNRFNLSIFSTEYI